MRLIFAICLLLALLLSGAGLAYVTGAAAVAGYVLTGHGDFLRALPGRMFGQLDVFAFMAMPLFILVGEIMNRGGVTKALVEFSALLVGRIRGGLGYVNILTSVFFAGISGSAIADSAALSNTLAPAMEKQGYTKQYAGAITAASSIIGPIIPPSIILVFYGSIMGVDVAALFAAGIVPGALLAGVLMAANGFFAWKLDHPRGQLDAGAFWPALLRALPSLGLPLIIIAGIVFGVMTPTEAAAVAVFAALGVSAIYGALNPRMVFDAFKRTVALSGTIFVMLAAAALVTLLAALTHVPQSLGELVVALGLEGAVFLFIFTLVFIVMGMISETQIALALLAPLLAPLAEAQGAHPVHIGVIICLTLAMGLITPPLGGSVLVTATVTEQNYWGLMRATLPFAALEIALLFVLVYAPGLTLALPKWLGLI